MTGILGQESSYLAGVSPDGTKMAWVQGSGKGKDRVGQMCLYTFESASKVCYNLSISLYNGFPSQIAWAPDSSAIVFSEDPVNLSYESDIWLFKVADGTFTDLTDDKQTGNWAALPKGSFQIDYVPSWSAANNQIYFWRIIPTGNMTGTMGIFSIAPTGGTPKQIYDLSSGLGLQFPHYQNEKIFLDGFSVVSPDGKKLAAFISGYENSMATTTSNNLYIFDLANPSVAPRKVLTDADLQKALPEWQAQQGYPAVPTGLSWKGDSAGLVVMAVSGSSATPFSLFYYVDADTGKSTPVVDFSQLASSDAYFQPAPSGIPWRYYSPWTASLSPKNDKLMMFTSLGNATGVLVANLPPDGKLPSVSATSQPVSNMQISNSSRAKDGKVVMYGYLLQTNQK